MSRLSLSVSQESALSATPVTRPAPATPFPREHPLLTQRYCIPTPDLIHLEQSLRLWHRAGITGGVLLGGTRIGKTSGVDECVVHITEILETPR
jgi:hypothetical protein